MQAQFNGPIGIAIDAKGRLFIVDTYNDKIRMLNLDGVVSILAGQNKWRKTALRKPTSPHKLRNSHKN